MKKSASMLMLASILASQENFSFNRRESDMIEKVKIPFEEKPKSGQFEYWFRSDGTFLSSRNEERMLSADVFYECFAINDKTAIKKFDKHISSIQESNV